MNISQKDAETLQGLAKRLSEEMVERGGHAVLVLWTRCVDGRWNMEWAREGSPYEAVHLAQRYASIDAQQAQAHAIAAEMRDDDGEGWKA